MYSSHIECSIPPQKKCYNHWSATSATRTHFQIKNSSKHNPLLIHISQHIRGYIKEQSRRRILQDASRNFDSCNHIDIIEPQTISWTAAQLMGTLLRHWRDTAVTDPVICHDNVLLISLGDAILVSSNHHNLHITWVASFHGLFCIVSREADVTLLSNTTADRRPQTTNFSASYPLQNSCDMRESTARHAKKWSVTWFVRSR